MNPSEARPPKTPDGRPDAPLPSRVGALLLPLAAALRRVRAPAPSSRPQTPAEARHAAYSALSALGAVVSLDDLQGGPPPRVLLLHYEEGIVLGGPYDGWPVWSAIRAASADLWDAQLFRVTLSTTFPWWRGWRRTQVAVVRALYEVQA